MNVDTCWTYEFVLTLVDGFFFTENVVVDEEEGEDDGAGLGEEDIPDDSADYFEDYDEAGDWLLRKAWFWIVLFSAKHFNTYIHMYVCKSAYLPFFE